MITPPAIPGFEFTKEPYEDLVARYHAIPGYTSELLGYSVNGRPIYGFALGDMSKPTMYVQGNIHGSHEWRTCWWVSEFMTLLTNPSISPAHTAILNDLRARYSFYFIPSINADGYGTPTVSGRYGNVNGVSLSENFDVNWEEGNHSPSPEYRGPYPWSEPESQIVRDKILALQPVSVLCNHSWGGHTGFTTRQPQNTTDAPAISEFYTALKAELDYDSSYDSKLSPKLVSGSAYNWAGTLTSSADRPIIGQVFEAGDQSTAYDQARMGMTGILYHMLMVDSMLPSPDPDPPIPHDDKPITFPTSWGPVRIDGRNCSVASVDTFTDGNLSRIWP